MREKESCEIAELSAMEQGSFLLVMCLGGDVICGNAAIFSGCVLGGCDVEFSWLRLLDECLREMCQKSFGHMDCVKYSGRKFEQDIAGGRAALGI